jgi:hypothetical protein
VRDKQPIDAVGTVDRVQVGELKAVGEHQHGWRMVVAASVPVGRGALYAQKPLFYLSGSVRRPMRGEYA